jgi:hypothetical protein
MLAFGGMHADGATEAIIDAAPLYKKPLWRTAVSSEFVSRTKGVD